MLFVLVSSSLGQTLAFAICFCVSRINLILIIYDNKANIIQITSSRSHFFCFRFQMPLSKPAKSGPCLDSNAIEILIFLFLYLTPCPINFSKPQSHKILKLLISYLLQNMKPSPSKIPHLLPDTRQKCPAFASILHQLDSLLPEACVYPQPS